MRQTELHLSEEDRLDLYSRPFRALEPVVWRDEESKQMLRDARDLW